MSWNILPHARIEVRESIQIAINGVIEAQTIFKVYDKSIIKAKNFAWVQFLDDYLIFSIRNIFYHAGFFLVLSIKFVDTLSMLLL